MLGLAGGDQTPYVDQVRAFLEPKQVLLVLDNFEHLLGSAETVSALLATCPGLKCVVTSRERLNLEAEQIFGVLGLSYPEHDAGPDLLGYDAPEFFVRQAGRALVTLELHDADLPTVAELCRLTDGLPLALELAATWLFTLPLAEVVGELEQGLGLLESSASDRNVRHRSISGVIA